jgi:hypothetical protein
LEDNFFFSFFVPGQIQWATFLLYFSGNCVWKLQTRFHVRLMDGTIVQWHQEHLNLSSLNSSLTLASKNRPQNGISGAK